MKSDCLSIVKTCLNDDDACGRFAEIRCRATGEGSQDFLGPLLASAAVQMGWDSPCESFGLSFKPNGQFWTHSGPVLTILGRTRTLVNQDLDLETFGQP